MFRILVKYLGILAMLILCHFCFILQLLFQHPRPVCLSFLAHICPLLTMKLKHIFIYNRPSLYLTTLPPTLRFAATSLIETLSFRCWQWGLDIFIHIYPAMTLDDKSFYAILGIIQKSSLDGGGGVFSLKGW